MPAWKKEKLNKKSMPMDIFCENNDFVACIENLCDGRESSSKLYISKRSNLAISAICCSKVQSFSHEVWWMIYFQKVVQ